ncbi:GNAT family N-acetyltransferase [Paenibacillus chartarius]|uniref:GNAT family N-acetyltransferase n=1 Tax=Paenibacillus chartarius TaxID=747481 RepID=A0ABV6DRD6_9BACL
MIRKRIPAIDDGAIFQMVVRQLLPFARAAVPTAQTSMPAIVKRLNGNDFTLTVAEGRRAPFGFITCRCRERKMLIDMLALDERYQGGGLGTALMRAAERQGLKKGCREAYLYVDAVNWRAQRFYVGKGYLVESYEPSVHCYRMSKRLAEF